MINSTITWIDSHPIRAAALAKWAVQGVNLLSNLLIMPLIFYQFGTEISGIWFFMLSWTGAFALVDFGLSQSVTRQIAFSHGEKTKAVAIVGTKFLNIWGDRASQAVFAGAKRIFLWTAIIVVLSSVLAERTFLFSGNLSAGFDVRLTWYFVALSAVGLLMAKPYQSLLEGGMLPSWQQISILLATLVGKIVLIVALLLGAPIWAIGAIFCLGNWTQFISSRWCVSLRLPSLMAMDSKPKKNIMKALWPLSWPQGVASTGAYMTFAVNPIIIGFFLGAVAIPEYFIPWRLANIIESAAYAILVPNLSFFIKMLAENKIKALLSKYFVLFAIINIFVIVAFSFYVIFGVMIVDILSAGKVRVSFTLMLAFAIYHILAVIQTSFAIFIVAHGRQPFAVVATVGAVFNISLAVILIPRYGVLGAVIGTALAQLMTNNWFIAYYFLRLLKEHMKQVGRQELLATIKFDVRLLVSRLIGAKMVD